MFTLVGIGKCYPFDGMIDRFCAAGGKNDLL